MDHFQALLEKIERLRAEIADIKLLNERYRLAGAAGEARVAHLERHERLQQIQKELIQLFKLVNKAFSMEKRIEEQFSRRYPLKRAS